MKRIASFCSSLMLIVVVGGWTLGGGASLLLAQEPILETYSINQGGRQATKPSEFEAELSDKFFGGNTARSRIKFLAKEATGSLSLLVFRTVNPGEVVFALLTSRVEVRGYDSAGAEVYARDLSGFTFGDSQPGIWSQELEDVPLAAQQIKVTFFGNYE